MTDSEAEFEQVQLELSHDVLCRLIRERKLVASEVRYLNRQSSKAGWWAIKYSLLD